MEITLKLFATLRDYLPAGSKDNAMTLSLGKGAAIGDVLKTISIPEDIKLTIFVNGVHADKGRVLEQGDVLAVFPPIAGG